MSGRARRKKLANTKQAHGEPCTPLGEQETRDASVDRSQHGEQLTRLGEPSTRIVEHMLQDGE